MNNLIVMLDVTVMCYMQMLFVSWYLLALQYRIRFMSATIIHIVLQMICYLYELKDFRN